MIYNVYNLLYPWDYLSIIVKDKIPIKLYDIYHIAFLILKLKNYIVLIFQKQFFIFIILYMIP